VSRLVSRRLRGSVGGRGSESGEWGEMLLQPRQREKPGKRAGPAAGLQRSTGSVAGCRNGTLDLPRGDRQGGVGVPLPSNTPRPWLYRVFPRRSCLNCTPVLREIHSICVCVFSGNPLVAGDRGVAPEWVSCRAIGPIRLLRSTSTGGCGRRGRALGRSVPGRRRKPTTAVPFRTRGQSRGGRPTTTPVVDQREMRAAARVVHREIDWVSILWVAVLPLAAQQHDRPSGMCGE